MTEKQIQDLVPVILAGGSGTRLWPVSRTLSPKHLVPLVGQDTLIIQTAKRNLALCNSKRLIIVGAESQGPDIKRQMKDVIGPLGKHLVLEPSARNTAVAVGLAARQASQSYGNDCLIFVCPSDHLISKQEAYERAVHTGANAARDGYLVTFGISPDRAETGFGYIKMGPPLSESCDVLAVDKFVEKPAKPVAEQMLQDGGYVWNSGMFLMRADVLLEELEEFEPEISNAVAEIFKQRDVQTGALDPVRFAKIKSMPIDKAVMERSSKIAVVPCDPGWSDLGSWQAMWEYMPRDEHDNAVDGDVIVHSSAGNIVKASHRLVALSEVSDLAVIETPDAVLISDRTNSEGIKSIVGLLDKDRRIETQKHRNTAEAWGTKDIIDQGERFQIIRLEIAPGGQFRLTGACEFAVAVLLSGRCTAFANDQSNHLKPGTTINVHQNTRIENDGTSIALLSLSIGSK